jgi:hypothetical protein
MLEVDSLLTLRRKTTTIRRTLLGAALVSSVAGTACRDEAVPGQAMSTTPDASCLTTSCAVELQQLVTLSDSTGVLYNTRVPVEQDRLGRYLVSCCYGESFAIYDAAGTLIHQIGRKGSGPGEFRFARKPLVGPGDSIHVSDARLNRMTVFGPDLQPARTFPLPHRMFGPTMMLPDGSYLANTQLPTPERIGYPIHHMSPEGVILRSFGADPPQHRQDMALLTFRLMGRADDGHIWTVAPGRYVLEKWHPVSARLVRRVEVRSEWFRESAKYIDDPGVRPNPVIEGIAEGTEGLVWVLIRDPDLDWQPRPAEPVHVEKPTDPDDYDATFDWILEAVQSETGRIVASRRFRKYALLTSAGVLTTRHATQDPAVVAWDVWRPQLSLTEKED